MSNYQHIFTDGLDKLLSVSIWLSDYGKGDTFAYYTKNKLKGYVSSKDMEALAEEGYMYLQNEQNVQELLQQSAEVTQQVNELEKSLAEKETYTQAKITELFIEFVSLLARGYSLYFSTEEYSTTKLSLEKNADVIKEIGQYRLEFIETCVKATEAVYALAALLGEKHGISEKDIQFLTHDEVVELSQKVITPEEIEKRKQHFLVRMHPGHGLRYFYGKDALIEYEALVSTKELTGNTLEGAGASKGIVRGSVYILSLADENLTHAIDTMPQGSILVSESTQPHLVLACKKALAIVTDEGGVLSHAAIISRELGIPCVVGTRNATEVLKNGQKVEVNGEKGLVTILS